MNGRLEDQFQSSSNNVHIRPVHLTTEIMPYSGGIEQYPLGQEDLILLHLYIQYDVEVY